MSGIVGFPGARGLIAPGATVTAGVFFAPAGLVNAAPNAPTTAMFRLINGAGNPAVAPLQLSGGVASGTLTNYRADEGAVVLSVGNGGGATNAVLSARGEARWCVAEGPWRAPSPGVVEPSLAICGWRAVIRHRLAAAGVGVGHGWFVTPQAGGGNPWVGGPLAAEGGNFRNDGTRPYVVFEAPAGGGGVRFRVRGNDGVVRFYASLVNVNPLVHYSVDWRVYRATRNSPARYACYLNDVLAFQQSMSEGAGPGNESASPTADGQSVVPMIWNQLDGGTGATFQQLCLYSGYDDSATTRRD